MLRLINNAFKKVGKEDWITGNMRRYFFIPQNVLGSTTSMTETVNKVALGKKKKATFGEKEPPFRAHRLNCSAPAGN